MMKKLIVLLILVLSFLRMIAQNNTELDIKNGFKDFQIGDDYSKWKDYMYELIYENPSSVPVGSKLYNYIGSCCRKIFDFDLKEIRLTFYNNKLVVIDLETINFKNFYNRDHTIFMEQGYKELNQSLTNIFGTPAFNDMPQNKAPIYIITGWAGKKNALLSRYCYIGVEEGDYATISFYDIEYNKLMNNIGF
jgi:hypothetical protein